MQPAGACCSLPPNLNLTKFSQRGNACANSEVSRGSDVIVHGKMGLNPYKCDVSAIIVHISQERGRHQTGAGSHCKTRPKRHKVLYKKIYFASVIFDIVILIFATKLWKKRLFQFLATSASPVFNII